MFQTLIDIEMNSSENAFPFFKNVLGNIIHRHNFMKFPTVNFHKPQKHVKAWLIFTFNFFNARIKLSVLLLKWTD